MMYSREYIIEYIFVRTMKLPLELCTIYSINLVVLGRGGSSFNTLRRRQNGCLFPDGILKCIFLNENEWILIHISLKFVPKGPIYSISALVQVMALHQPGGRSLS